MERIWADGNLLRGRAGDFKSEVGGFRLFAGDPDQPAAQLVASAEGVAFTPSYRGMAYALFEDMQLGDYGNRIPSLTFEVVADEGLVEVADIGAELSGGLLNGAGDDAVGGYAASGPSVADAMEPLINAYGMRVRPSADGLTLDSTVAAVSEIGSHSLAKRVNGENVVPMTSVKQAAALVPHSLSIRHYDVGRDYQAGLQRASRPGAGRQQAQIDLPAVISAHQAKRLAVARTAMLWKGRTSLEVICGWRELARAPGGVISVNDVPGLWAIEALQWEKMAVKLSLRQISAGTSISVDASSGSVVRQADAPHGPTRILLADLPNLGDSAATVPAVVAAAAGASTGWRWASLSVEEGDEIVGIGQTAAPAVLGTSLSVPAAVGAVLFDDVTALDVELLAPDMVLAGASDDALLRGANLCLLGQELLQFGRAVRLGPRQYRLSRLLRGRRGTEWAIAMHGIGEDFLLIEADALTMVPDAYVRTGGTVTLLALGLGDLEPAEAQLRVMGAALKPPSPVHLTITPDAGGNRTVRWTRRSRVGWAWMDHVDAPLGEEFERYRLRVLAGETVLRTTETIFPEFSYSAAMAAEDTALGPLTVEVIQVGAMGASIPTRAVLVA